VLVGVKGCAMRRSLSPARCGFARWCRGVLVAGGVASMEWCPTRHVVVRRVLVRWSIPVYQAVVMSPCSSSRLKRPSVCSPVLPVNGLLEQDQSPCGRGFHCRLYDERL